MNKKQFYQNTSRSLQSNVEISLHVQQNICKNCNYKSRVGGNVEHIKLIP